MSNTAVKLFEKQQVRSVWDEKEEKWWFSVVDIIRILAEQPTQRRATLYWSKLKERLEDEGAVQLLTNCQQLKMVAADGKKYKTDALDAQDILRLIQSIPSKKAEPFKQWLAQVGNEAISEASDPELAIDRAIANYRWLGYDEGWINQRLQSINVRKALTDEWSRSGVKRGREYAELTDLMYKTRIKKLWCSVFVAGLKNRTGKPVRGGGGG